MHHNREQEVGLPEWETRDKGEGQSGEFCCLFVLRLSKQTNISGKGLENFQTEMGRGRGWEGRQVSSSLSIYLRVFYSCTILKLYTSFIFLSILLADRRSWLRAYSAGETKQR